MIMVPMTGFSQSGGRKKEGITRRRGNFHLTRWRSMGHADEFARGSSGRHGKIYRLFHRPKPSWTYHSSGSNRSHWKANQFLFERHRTPGKIDNDNFQYRMNRERSKKRPTGNKVFKRRKYKRR